MTDNAFTFEEVFGSAKEARPQAEAGAYYAELVRVETKANRAKGNNFRVWTFRSVDGGTWLTGPTDLRMDPESRAFAWMTALLGRTPAKGDTLDSGIGKVGTVEVVMNKRGYAEVVAVRPDTRPKSDTQAIANEPVGF